MPLNSLVQRLLQQTGQAGGAQPSDTMDRMQSQKNALEQYAAMQNAQMAGADTSYPGAPSGSSGGGSSWFGSVLNGVKGAAGDAQIQRIMKTIRNRESGGNYTIRNPTPGMSASGAYQFTNGTWGNYGGYASAYLAPKHVQDARAEQDVRRFLAMGKGISAVPGMWYRPATYLNQGSWDSAMGAGNPLTMRQYIDKWMADYNSYG